MRPARTGLFIAAAGLLCAGGLAASALQAHRAWRRLATLQAAYQNIHASTLPMVRFAMRYALVCAYAHAPYAAALKDETTKPLPTFASWDEVERIAHDPVAFDAFQRAVEQCFQGEV